MRWDKYSQRMLRQNEATVTDYTLSIRLLDHALSMVSGGAIATWGSYVIPPLEAPDSTVPSQPASKAQSKDQLFREAAITDVAPVVAVNAALLADGATRRAHIVELAQTIARTLGKGEAALAALFQVRCPVHSACCCDPYVCLQVVVALKATLDQALSANPQLPKLLRKDTSNARSAVHDWLAALRMESAQIPLDCTCT